MNSVVYRALEPEARSIPSYRVKVKLHYREEGLTLSVVAEDPVVLRAVLNSYVRWIRALEKVYRATVTEEERI